MKRVSNINAKKRFYEILRRVNSMYEDDMIYLCFYASEAEFEEWKTKKQVL